MSKIKDWILRKQEIDSQDGPDMDGPGDGGRQRRVEGREFMGAVRAEIVLTVETPRTPWSP